MGGSHREIVSNSADPCRAPRRSSPPCVDTSICQRTIIARPPFCPSTPQPPLLHLLHVHTPSGAARARCTSVSTCACMYQCAPLKPHPHAHPCTGRLPYACLNPHRSAHAATPIVEQLCTPFANWITMAWPARRGRSPTWQPSSAPCQNHQPSASRHVHQSVREHSSKRVQELHSEAQSDPQPVVSPSTVRTQVSTRR